MRIISNFRDYYDVNLQYGIDPNIIFKRKSKEISDNTEIRNLLYRKSYDNIGEFLADSYYHNFYNKVTRIKLVPNILFFCDKIYRFYEYTNNGNVTINYDGVVITDSNKNELDYLNRKITRFYSQKLEEFPNYLSIKNEMINSRCPIILMNYGRHEGFIKVYNPILKDIQFQRMMDPVSCFQEISMWIGNLGMEGGSTVEISNQSKIDKHGYTSESFKRRAKKC